MSLSTNDALEATLYNVQIRSVVEDTLKSMLMDVELAVSLEADLTVQQEATNLKQRALASEIALKEAQIVEQQAHSQKKLLADDLVDELWSLSQELGQLRRWKKEQEHSVTERDSLMAKLLQAQDEIEQLKLRPAVSSEEATTEAVVTHATTDAASVSTLKDPPPSSSTQSTLKDPPPSQPDIVQETSAEETVAQSIAAEQPVETSASIEEPTIVSIPTEAIVQLPERTTTTEPSATVVQLPEQTTEPNAAAVQLPTTEPSSPAEQPETSAAEETPPAVVALVEHDEDVPQLETFEESILLQVFSFMDAVEIVNLAQANIALYSRVDSLFGIGAEDSPVPTQISTTTTAPAPAAPEPSATIVALPPPVTDTKSAPSKPATTGGGIISLFQTRAAQATTVARAIKAREKSPPRAAGSAQQQQPLSAAMANSMAAKLTDKEINAIISMTEKLNQRNVQVDALSKSNTDLTGKLEGTEAVKEFLINKVRELESRQNRNSEVERKTTQQIASDQEVIGFLDSRVQELERNERSILRDKKTASESLVSVKVQKEQKITVLSDMLQYEREKLAESERDWKSTRKVLVKEVKNCRAQIMALQAERDGLQEQNDRLKKAVLATSAMNGNL